MQYAITRKGSEFGSAYKASGINNGDMLCWHDLNGIYDDQQYKSYTDTSDEMRGKPSDEKFPGGNWVVAARTGGLRAGDLAQAVGEKYGGNTKFNNYDEKYITDRFWDDAYKKDEKGNATVSWGYYDGNTTRTANNYCVPTISTSSDAEGEDIVVNVYLGNNGRLYTQDTLLLVTKRLESMQTQALSDEEKDKLFDFQVTIDGFTGARQAVRVKYNDTAKSWQRQLHYIDMELDGNMFLQNTDGSKAMVDKNGYRVIASSGEDENKNPYDYVYAEEIKDAEGNVLHSANEPYRPDENNNGPFYVYIYSGLREFYAKSVTLILADDSTKKHGTQTQARTAELRLKSSILPNWILQARTPATS